MLPLEAALSDEQIAALIAYATEEFGDTRRNVKAISVSKWRKKYADRTIPWKRAELEEALAEATAPPFLSNLRYQIYEGKWEELPDFSALSPATVGTLKDGPISLNPAKDRKGAFGMVFDAEFTLREAGDYHFSLTSDDGSALVIDGETLIGNDGVHPARTVNMKETLQAGLHTMQVQYFERGGERSLALAVRGPDTKSVTRWLSTETSEARKAAQSYDPIPLTALRPGEAIVHRAFLPDAKPRAIGVGYPGAVNLVWDADVLNLAYVYRGDFMDAASHWNGRGAASTPLGKDRVKIAHGLPFQILESLDEPWQSFSETKVKYERDTANPQKEITINLRHPDYQFRGYHLDAKRFPTFRYDYRNLAVADTFVPAEVDGVTALIRTVKIEGTPEEHTWFRIAASGSQAVAGDWIDVGSNLALKVDGAKAISRTCEGNRETLVSVTRDMTLTLTYRWNNPLRP